MLPSDVIEQILGSIDEEHPCKSNIRRAVAKHFVPNDSSLAERVRELLHGMGLVRLFEERMKQDSNDTQLVVRAVCNDLQNMHAAASKIDRWNAPSYDLLWKALRIRRDEREYFEPYLILNCASKFLRKYDELKVCFKTCDRSLVLGTVAKYGLALQYAPEGMKADKAVVKAAVGQDGLALQYASEGMKADKAVVTAAVEQDGAALKYASGEMKEDRGVVTAAVEQDGLALQYASEEMKADEAVVMTAVENEGFALEFASEEMKNNGRVVMAAVEQDALALQYAPEGIRETLLERGAR